MTFRITISSGLTTHIIGFFTFLLPVVNPDKLLRRCNRRSATKGKLTAGCGDHQPVFHPFARALDSGSYRQAVGFLRSSRAREKKEKETELLRRSSLSSSLSRARRMKKRKEVLVSPGSVCVLRKWELGTPVKTIVTAAVSRFLLSIWINHQQKPSRARS